MATPEFQFGDVVRFKDEYVYSDEDADGLWRGVVIGVDERFKHLFHVMVLTPGANGEEVGEDLLMPVYMFEIDNTKGEQG
jgi:hypothetical protein